MVSTIHWQPKFSLPLPHSSRPTQRSQQTTGAREFYQATSPPQTRGLHTVLGPVSRSWNTSRLTKTFPSVHQSGSDNVSIRMKPGQLHCSQCSTACPPGGRPVGIQLLTTPTPTSSGLLETQAPTDLARASSSEAFPATSQSAAQGQEASSGPSTLLQAEANTEVPISSVPAHVNGNRSRRSSGLLAASRLSQLDWSINGQGVALRKGTEERSNPDLSIHDGSPDATDDGRLASSKGKGKERASPVDEKVKSMTRLLLQKLLINNRTVPIVRSAKCL